MIAAAVAAVFVAAGLPAATATAAFDPDDFAMGGDLGMIHEIESLGGQFSRGGVVGDPIDIMGDAGMNLARLRLWVDPYTATGEPYGGGTNDLATTIATAQRAKAAGMDILLDFHLSDWWADPGTQTLPKAWRELSYPQLLSTVRQYTEDVIDAMRGAGVLPDMVQMGNEIPGGILWDHGRVGNGVSDFTQLTELLEAGISGVDAALRPGEDIEIVLHLDHGGDNALYRWWFDAITAAGVPFDIIGLSYYPFWHGTMGELAANLNDVSARYGKDVLVVETAYGWTLGDGDGLGNSFYTAEELTGGYPASPGRRHSSAISATSCGPCRTDGAAVSSGGNRAGFPFRAPTGAPRRARSTTTTPACYRTRGTTRRCSTGTVRHSRHSTSSARPLRRTSPSTAASSRTVTRTLHRDGAYGHRAAPMVTRSSRRTPRSSGRSS